MDKNFKIIVLVMLLCITLGGIFAYFVNDKMMIETKELCESYNYTFLDKPLSDYSCYSETKENIQFYRSYPFKDKRYLKLTEVLEK